MCLGLIVQRRFGRAQVAERRPRVGSCTRYVIGSEVACCGAAVRRCAIQLLGRSVEELRGALEAVAHGHNPSGSEPLGSFDIRTEPRWIRALLQENDGEQEDEGEDP